MAQLRGRGYLSPYPRKSPSHLMMLLGSAPADTKEIQNRKTNFPNEINLQIAVPASHRPSQHAVQGPRRRRPPPLFPHPHALLFSAPPLCHTSLHFGAVRRQGRPGGPKPLTSLRSKRPSRHPPPAPGFCHLP